MKYSYFLQKQSAIASLLGLLLFASAPVSAQWIGAKTGSGSTSASRSYLSTANWTNGQVLGTFDSTLTGDLTLYFSDDYTPTGDINLNHAGAFNLTLLGGGRVADSGTVPAASHTLHLNGSLNVNTAVTTAQVVIGSTGSTSGLTVDLNGATRVISVADNGSVLTLANGIMGTGAGFTKQGAGDLSLEAASSYDGVTTVVNGGLFVKHNQALGSTAAGTVVDSSAGGSNAYLRLSGNITVSDESLYLHGNGEAINGGILFSVTGSNTWTGPITIGNISGVADNTRIGAYLGTIAGSATPIPSFRSLLTLAGNITLSPEATDQLVLQGDNSGLITGNISGGSQLTKGIYGFGTWALSGTNTYTGQTNITNGNLQFVKRVSLYNADTSKWNTNFIKVNAYGGLVLNMGGTGEFTEAEFQALTSTDVAFAANSRVGIDPTNAAGGTYTYATPIGNGGATDRGFVKRGAGTLTLSANNTFTGVVQVEQGTLILSGANAYNGITEINGGTLNVRNNNALGTNTNGVNIIRDSSGDSLSQLQLEGNITIAGEKLTVSGIAPGGVGPNADLVNISGNNIWAGNWELTQGLQVEARAGKLTVSGNISSSPSSSIAVWNTGAGAVDYTGVISGTGGFGIANTGSTTLSGLNTFTGYLSINNGTLNINNNAPSGAAGALGNSTSRIDLSQSNAADPLNVYITGPYTVGRSFYIYDYISTGTPGMVTFGGTTASTATFNGSITAYRATTFSQAAGGTLVLRGGIITSLVEPTPLRFTGPGNFVIENLSITMTGTTSLTIDANTSVALNTNILGNSTAQIFLNGLLSGTGTINNSPLIVGATGIIAPGNSAGALQVAALQLNANSTLRFELGAPGPIGSPGNDYIEIHGNLILDGQLDVTPLAGFRTGSYTLLYRSGTGSFTNNGLNVRSMPAGFAGAISIDAYSVNLVVTAVPIPEPSTYALLAMSALGWMYHRRKKTRAIETRIDGCNV